MIMRLRTRSLLNAVALFLSGVLFTQFLVARRESWYYLNSRTWKVWSSSPLSSNSFDNQKFENTSLALNTLGFQINMVGNEAPSPSICVHNCSSNSK